MISNKESNVLKLTESQILKKNLKNRLEKLKKIKKDVEDEISLVVSCLKESCNDD